MITRPLPPPPATVADLAAALGARCLGAAGHLPLAGLADDSRSVRPGFAFFARKGAKADGATYAKEAYERGAACVVADVDLPGLPTLRVEDAAAALRQAADLWYGRPQEALDLVGITGTKGKTTTSYLTAAALRAAGRKVAVLGTIAYDLGDGRPIPADTTTPGLLDLRRFLARARDHRCDTAVMEVSSHALDQGRTDGLDFAVGVLTNVASDHLDYHLTAEAYLEAKTLLFRALPSSATAVLNVEDPAWPRFAEASRGRKVVTYGWSPTADLRAERIRLAARRTTFRLVHGLSLGAESLVEVETPLVGRHNVLNLLAAVSAAEALGVDVVTAVRGASSLEGVRGRLERVEAPDVNVFVDYAHTEDALRQVLGFLREVGATPLTCVVGCGGDRDRTKRPRMASVAAEMSDRVVYTSDNPRTEEPLSILAEMTAGVPRHRVAHTVVVPDRREAIRRAVLEAPPLSTVLVAGKGHEDYQIVGTTKHPFDDVAEVRSALEARAARALPVSPVRGSPPAV